MCDQPKGGEGGGAARKNLGLEQEHTISRLALRSLPLRILADNEHIYYSIFSGAEGEGAKNISIC